MTVYRLNEEVDMKYISLVALIMYALNVSAPYEGGTCQSVDVYRVGVVPIFNVCKSHSKVE